MSAEKRALRKELKKLPPLPPDTKRRSDGEILQSLLLLPELKRAKSVFAYVSTPGEPDTRGLIEALLSKGVPLLVPRCRPDGRMDAALISSLHDLSPAPPYGILEPPESFPAGNPALIDVIITPGAAFAETGARLGHGAGYYDRFFLRSGALRVALAYERTVFERLPVEPHDLPVHIIVTESRVIRI